MNWLRSRKTAAVHSGNFHADDVFSVAILALYLGYIPKVIRTRDQAIINKSDYALDVGKDYDPANNRFDHHREGWDEKRNNGILYATCGLMWKQFGQEISGSKEVADLMDEKIFQIIDAEDNGMEVISSCIPGVKTYSAFDYIFSFNPTWREEDCRDEAFLKAVKVAIQVLNRELIRARDFIDGEKAIMAIYNSTADKRILILDHDYNYKRVTENLPEPLLIIKPVPQNNTWHITTIKVKGTLFQGRIDFPLAWAGKSDEELQKITGVKEAIFCHNKRFITVAKTKEGAIKLAQLAIAEIKP